MHTLIISSRYNKMFCLNRHTYSLNIFFSLDHVSRYVYKVQINVLHIIRDWRVILFNLLRILVHIFTGFYKIDQLSLMRPYSTVHILVMLWAVQKMHVLTGWDVIGVLSEVPFISGWLGYNLSCKCCTAHIFAIWVINNLNSRFLKFSHIIWNFLVLKGRICQFLTRFQKA